MADPELTFQIASVLGLLLLTVYLFVSEVVRVDVAAVLVMSLIGLASLFPVFDSITDPLELFAGFSSNAVMSIIAVMIIGEGLDKTGLMTQITGWILRIGGRTERHLVALISGTVGITSSFMQNVGAAALFLPVVSRIASRTGLPISRLLMPMGFCAILGGTVTLVGSSPLILLNELILSSNRMLPDADHMRTFGLFSVTPVGLALLAMGIGYFMLVGRWLLPAVKVSTESSGTAAYFQRVYGLHADVFEVGVSPQSPLVGTAIGQLESEYRVGIIATHFRGRTRLSPSRDVLIEGPAVLAVMGAEKSVRSFAEQNGLNLRDDLRHFSEDLSRAKSGISEIVIPPYSEHIGKNLSELWFRKTHDISVLAIHRGEEAITESVRDTRLQAGDALVCHSAWEALARLEKDRNFVVLTTDYPHEELRPQKLGFAVLFFMLALGLALFSDLRLSVSLMIGAVGMIVSGVLSMDEAYQAVSWKTVFLLASLIPLGQLVESSGTAAWIAEQTLRLVGDLPIWALQATVAGLATVFSLVMSNVGATVLLVPLAVNLALQVGADPAIFALTVAIATSNSFIIPTHQVNALIMSPGGYRVSDYLRAGSLMTVLFLVVSITTLNLVF